MTTMDVRRMDAALDAFPPEVADAWRDSFFGELPEASTRRLLVGARLAQLEAGEIFYRGAFHEETATLAVVVEGLVRMYMKSDDGRQMTVHYAPVGAVVGVPSVLLTPASRQHPRSLDRFRMLGGEALDGEALRDSAILKLQRSNLRAAAWEDPHVGTALARYLAERLLSVQRTIAADLFLPIRCRLASHLLDLAERDGHWLVVRSNHQSIAASIGSVREVVSRTLKRLEREGLIEREVGGPGCVRLVDTAGLHQLASGGGHSRLLRVA